jgi:hypothetical protein
MIEQVQTLFDSDVAEFEEEVSVLAMEGKRLIYGIGDAVQQLRRAKVKKKDILILLPRRAMACIKLAAPVELLQGRGRLTLFGCRVGINKQSDRIFIGQEVKV